MVRYSALKGLYETEKTIGCGGFAKVKLATHVATGEKVAIKIMDKSLLGDDLPRVKLEVKALKTLSHVNICKLYQVIETESHFFLIVEYCSGGELFDHIVEKSRLTESESRMFFRQIVSAVAYLHSLGYAHRDLKPENVLLDKNQNLKLIDFGLCAKPEGGIGSLLKTSCGSPTYAAPELVLGKKYFGPEVDVWSMGVLLYALLAGSLPFDDINIDSLYKKILSGKYEHPSFMSTQSKQLIRSMLQTDPKKRITVAELLYHPWITMGILEPVRYQSEDYRRYDSECVNIMAACYQVESEDLWRHLKKWRYDYHTATYLLLMGKKSRGQQLKLCSIGVNLPSIKINKPRQLVTFKPSGIENSPLNQVTTKNVTKSDNEHKSTPVTRSVRSTIEKGHLTPLIAKCDDTSSPSNFLEPTRPSSIRKPLKRIRSPTLDDASPIPAKKPTPGRSTPRTPDRKRTPKSSDTPGSARRMLCSLERSLHKVRHVLTPKKKDAESANSQQPVSLTSKELCNVSTTQCCDPEYVINELSKGLEKKGIVCQRNGFRLRGKVEPNVLHRFGGCSFELEICYLPNLGLPSAAPQHAITPTKSILKNGAFNVNTPIKSAKILTPASVKKSGGGNNKSLNDKSHLSPATVISKASRPAGFVGIRRKRLKGDSWCYKKVCEQVLALAATDLKKITESSV